MGLRDPYTTGTRVKFLSGARTLFTSVWKLARPETGKAPQNQTQRIALLLWLVCAPIISGSVVRATPQTPSPAATPSGQPATPAAQSITQTPASQQPASPDTKGAQSASGQPTLSLDQAVSLALGQASAYQQAALNEKSAAEDLVQAQAALKPKITSPSAYTYNTPLLNRPADTPHAQSFINLNAISEYQAFVSIGGDLDTNGKLHATIRRNRALLEAAHIGTQIARKALMLGVNDAYYNLALATAKRESAEQSLAAAQEFERITADLLSGGEVAAVDLIRARLQTAGRRDDLEKARSDEIVAAGGLRVLVGYDFSRPISSASLSMTLPVPGEIDLFTIDAITKRPEFAQFEAERRAEQEDIRVAHSERLPSLSYIFNGGVDSDSLRQPRIHEHIGASAALNLTVPIFDWGASKSRERQARLRSQVAENQRTAEIRAFAQEFYAARSGALSAANRIRIAGDAVVLAQNNLSSSIARYRAGEAAIIEVTDAQTTLATQRLALFQALFDYQSARARLALAVGQ
jgi:outer membrane protein TolC